MMSKSILYRCILLILSIAISGVLLELALKRIGVEPGIITQNSGFEKVDSLVVYQNYMVDESGIYRMSAYTRDSLPRYYDCSNRTIEHDRLPGIVSNTDNIFKILNDFHTLRSGSDRSDLPFSMFINSIRDQDDSLTQLQGAYMDYIRNPFNSEGFRSIEFNNYDTTAITVLLLGDSFGWGMSADPWYASFPDILSSMGYVVFNMCISGSDPSQYKVIAEKYLFQLDIDVVVTNLFIGNDLMRYERQATQDQPHEHVTNAGAFFSDPEGKYLPAEAAYSYYIDQISIPKTGWINRIASRSSLLTGIWILTHPGARNNVYGFFDGDLIEMAEISNKYVQAIDSLAHASNTLPLFCVIPNIESIEYGGQADSYFEDGHLRVNPIIAQSLMGSLEYHEPTNLERYDFPENDYHFNNSGMLKYALFIDSLIEHLYLNE